MCMQFFDKFTSFMQFSMFCKVRNSQQVKSYITLFDDDGHPETQEAVHGPLQIAKKQAEVTARHRLLTKCLSYYFIFHVPTTFDVCRATSCSAPNYS